MECRRTPKSECAQFFFGLDVQCSDGHHDAEAGDAIQQGMDVACAGDATGCRDERSHRYWCNPARGSRAGLAVTSSHGCSHGGRDPLGRGIPRCSTCTCVVCQSAPSGSSDDV